MAAHPNMNHCRHLSNADLLTLLTEGDEDAFLEIYFRYGRKLKRYVYGYVHDKELSEDLVQDIFIDLWQRRRSLPSHAVVDKYLFRAAKNQVLNHLRSEGVRKKYVEHFNQFIAGGYDNSNEETQRVNALQAVIDRGIAELPETCQQAFRLSRYEHVCIQEIADRMHVSPRTVEGYLTKTLAHLRSSLGEFMILLIFVLLR